MRFVCIFFNITKIIGKDGDTQYEALRQAQSAFYISVLVIQLFNLIACKARDRLPFGRFMLQ